MRGPRGGRRRNSPSPPDRISQKPAQRCASRRPRRKDDVDVTLPHPSIPQRHDIRDEDGHDAVHAAAADAGDGAGDAQLHHVAREAAAQAAQAEDGVREEEALLAAEDVAELAVEGLEAREGEEVPGGV